MARKIIPLISVFIISVLAVMFFFDTNSIDKDQLAETFVVDAIYYEEGQFVEITFEDRSQKTSKVVLEILGMKESFQKTFDDSKFVEKIPFEGTPKYGWATNPITLVIDHSDFGKIGLKTEIHPSDEPPRPIIYSSL